MCDLLGSSQGHRISCKVVAILEMTSEALPNMLRVLSRVNNKRGECLTLYRPVIDDCAEVKRLPFRVMYRLLVFVRFLTAISLAAP